MSSTQTTLPRLSSNLNLFHNLVGIDVLLTNKCNLRCTYCFQQHLKDYGDGFTVESLKRVWDWFKVVNGKPGKNMQFFGGEPLLYKKLIADFVNTHRKEFIAEQGNITTTIVTNGTLFDNGFIDEYLSVGTTEINFSIDTLDPKLCDRGLTEKQIGKILDSIDYSVARAQTGQLAARVNITPQNYTGFTDLFEELYERGIRRLWFHPLTHSLTGGNIGWTQETWNEWQRQVKAIVDRNLHFDHFTVAEGVGIKNQQGLHSLRDIAMDSTGDFTSCYVWISTKEELLGNIFRDEIDLDLIEKMRGEYETMITKNAQCVACDRGNLCYQFSSGNKANDGVYFRPDDMCQRVVDIYRDTNQRLVENKFRGKLTSIYEGYRDEGDAMVARSLMYLTKFYLDRRALPALEFRRPEHAEVTRALEGEGLAPAAVAGLFLKAVRDRRGSVPLDSLVREARGIDASEGKTVKELYYEIARETGHRETKTVPGKLDESLFYLTLLHLVVMGRTSYLHAVAYGGYE